MKRVRIKKVLQSPAVGEEITVCGWVRTFRSNRFIALNDGSTIKTLQCVIDLESADEIQIKKINTGAALKVIGTLVESQGSGQAVEIQVKSFEVLGESDPEKYPLQPKKHSLEFLREIAHLRMRTNTFSAVFRIRHAAAFAIHKFFNERGFVYVHSPIITGSDAEGAGEMFQVTTLDLANVPKTDEGAVDFKQDFFDKPTNLTVSGQLEAELGALGMSDVYTFAPTFRAENSNTSRHLAEFWMIEPEIAWADIHDDMDLAEDMLKYIIKYTLENCADDLEFLENRLIQEEKNKPQNERSPMALKEKLRKSI